MAERKKVAKPPGSTSEQFKAAVEAVAQLRDSGKLLVFVSPLAGVRLICDGEAFRTAYKAALGGTKSDKGLAQVQSEVTDLLSVYLLAASREGAQRLMERVLYSAERSKMDPGTRERSTKLFEDKLTLLEQRLVVEGLKRRVRRLDSTRGPGLEDLDIDVISEKTDNVGEEVIRGPFVRLSFRCSERSGAAVPLGLLRRIPGPVSGAVRPTDFSIEGDETDIDLLLRRLREAKAMLGKALEAPQSGGEAS